MFKRYRKKPVVIEAMQFDGTMKSALLITPWCAQARLPRGTEIQEDILSGECELIIKTLEGDHRASKNDWIIKGVVGELYPCKPDVFEKTYEEVGKEKTDEH